MTELGIDEKLKEEFPSLGVLTSELKVRVERESPELENFKQQVTKNVKERYALETLKDEPILRAYRDFFWRVGIDPTKTRPAAEALIRRVLGGNPLPKINTLVDAYNLASIDSKIAIAAFDRDGLRGDLLMRLAKSGEEFTGIGMEKPVVLKGNEVVIADEEKLIAVYPYRDADATKVTLETKNVLLLFCGVPRISLNDLENAEKIAIEHITRFCG